MKKIFLSLGLCAGLFALEFGSMGNTSAGLGNSGVALRKSAWGIYYNPALLASDNRGKFGYSFGAKISEKGILDFVSTNGTNPENMNFAKIAGGLNIASQNGIVIQITGGARKVPEVDSSGAPIIETDSEGKSISKMTEKRNPYGAFTMAAFASLYGHLNAQGNDQFLSGGGGVYALLEVPVGWGWRFETIAGDISVGAAIKYMGMSRVTNANISAEIVDGGISGGRFETSPFNFNLSHWFGIDLGVLYSPFDSLHIGLVAKNINAPSFDFNVEKNGKIIKETLRILPQFRLGLSYEFAKYFALTFDTDLAPNYAIAKGYGEEKSATMGGGLLMDFKYIDFRFGLMGNMADKFAHGVIMTGGINLLGFLDIAVQASSKMHTISGWKVPSYVDVKIGGSFTF